MTEDMAEHGDMLLREFGRVDPPVPAVLEAAREALWSAVAAEVLSTGPPGSAGKRGAAGPGRPLHEPGHRSEPGS